MDYSTIQIIIAGAVAPIMGYFMFKLKKKEQELLDLKINVAVLKETVKNISDDVVEIKTIVNRIANRT